MLGQTRANFQVSLSPWEAERALPAQHTGLSKSSVHRLKQALERRGVPPESWLWETAVGRQRVTRLLGATLDTFGLKPNSVRHNSCLGAGDRDMR
jgi:hypothetical protein